MVSAKQSSVFSDWDQARRSARAWLVLAKGKGIVTVLGGGWWKITGWNKPVQGFDALAIKLRGRGVIGQDGMLTKAKGGVQ